MAFDYKKEYRQFYLPKTEPELQGLQVKKRKYTEKMN